MVRGCGQDRVREEFIRERLKKARCRVFFEVFYVAARRTCQRRVRRFYPSTIPRGRNAFFNNKLIYIPLFTFYTRCLTLTARRLFITSYFFFESVSHLFTYDGTLVRPREGVVEFRISPCFRPSNRNVLSVHTIRTTNVSRKHAGRPRNRAVTGRFHVCTARPDRSAGKSTRLLLWRRPIRRGIRVRYRTDGGWPAFIYLARCFRTIPNAFAYRSGRQRLSWRSALMVFGTVFVRDRVLSYST